VVDVIRELESFACHVDVVDPHADSEAVFEEYGFKISPKASDDYDAVIIAVGHEEYANISEDEFKKMFKGNEGIIVDLKGIYKDKIKNIDYWSL